jgi:hypothetical protein
MYLCRCVFHCNRRQGTVTEARAHPRGVATADAANRTREARAAILTSALAASSASARRGVGALETPRRSTPLLWPHRPAPAHSGCARTTPARSASTARRSESPRSAPPRRRPLGMAPPSPWQHRPHRARGRHRAVLGIALPCDHSGSLARPIAAHCTCCIDRSIPSRRVRSPWLSPRRARSTGRLPLSAITVTSPCHHRGAARYAIARTNLGFLLQARSAG